MGRRAETRIVGDTVEKKCSKCGEFKAPHEYHQMIGGHLGLANKCIACYKNYYQENKERIIARQVAYEQENREVVTQRHRKWVLKNKYNLTNEEYSELIKNGCMICGKYDDLAVDYDHRTGEVRGILCRPCNTAIGIFKDNVELLLKAAAYLESKQGSIPEIRPSAKSE
jgi:Autographiviridae endonuclease VII